MEEIKLSELNILDIGNTIQMAGVIWMGQDGNPTFITTFPGKKEEFDNIKIMPMSLEDWEYLIRQSDLLETEIFEQDPSGKVVKSIYRKTQRQIDSYMQWAVFRRDNYACRYCGRTGIPLTVDHIILWEMGGPTIEDNLISSCKNCNKERGNMSYEDWLKSRQYGIRSRGLTPEVLDINNKVLADLPRLETLKVNNIRSRK